MQVQPYGGGTATKSANVSTQCPHGSVAGACPACSGGGGGGGSAKSTGLMGWNEAFAVWRSIQTAETRKQDYLQGITFTRERTQQDIQTASFRTAAQVLWARFTQGLQPLITGLLLPVIRAPFQAAVQALSVFQETGRMLGQGAGQLLQQIAQPITEVMNRLGSLLGDAQRRLEDFMQHNVEMLKSLIAQFQWRERLGQIQSLVGRVLGQFGPRQIFRTVERKVKSLLGQVAGWFGFTSEEERQSDN